MLGRTGGLFFALCSADAGSPEDEAEGFPSDPSLVLPGNLLRRRDAFLESPRSRHADKRFRVRMEDGDVVGREESEAEEVI